MDLRGDKPVTRRGAKKMRREEVKGHYVQVGLRAEEKDIIDRMCALKGTSASSFLRGLFIRYIRQHNIT